MRDLRAEGWSDDNRYLITRDMTTGEKFRLPADQRLTSLIAAHPSSSSQPGSPGQSSSKSSSGQLEIRMESSLSPRDIQTRIRRGESPQSVADSAGVPVERISGFAGPVLAEREFMCEQARKTTIRRKHVGGAGVLMGSLVSDSIVAAGGVPESAQWDAWRREDGRWSVVVTPAGQDEPATFVFDVKSRYVMPADQTAQDLVGDVPTAPSIDMAIADAVRASGRPLDEAEPVTPTAPPLPEPELDLDLPAVEVSSTDLLASHLPAADADTFEPAEPFTGVASLKAARDRRALEQLAISEVEEAGKPSQDEAVADDFENSLETNVAVPDTVGPRKKRQERRRVPSWDEIMFGDNKND